MMRETEMTNTNHLVTDIKSIILTARANAVRSVDFNRVQMYWNIGRRIFEDEQEGKERADYGSYLIKNVARQIEPEFGSGFSVRQLERARQFYRLYPIASTLRTQFILSSKYQLYLPSSEELIREIDEVKILSNSRIEEDKL